MGHMTIRFLISTLPIFQGVNNASYLGSIAIYISFTFWEESDLLPSIIQKISNTVNKHPMPVPL